MPPPVWIASLCQSWAFCTNGCGIWFFKIAHYYKPVLVSLKFWLWPFTGSSPLPMNMVFLNPRNEILLVFFKFWLYQAFYGVNGLALSELSDLQKRSGISHQINFFASIFLLTSKKYVIRTSMYRNEHSKIGFSYNPDLISVIQRIFCLHLIGAFCTNGCGIWFWK